MRYTRRLPPDSYFYARQKLIDREVANAKKLFRRPGAFAFRPAWSRVRGDTRYLRRFTRHSHVRREAAVSRRLFSQPGAFTFKPSWRGTKRKRGSKSAPYPKKRKFKFRR